MRIAHKIMKIFTQNRKNITNKKNPIPYKKMGQQQSPQLQQKLKNILQTCVQTLKPRLKTKSQISQLQQVLIDYQNNQELAQIIENVVKMIDKYVGKINVDQNKNMVEEEQYRKLQDLLQMLEAKQRQYIKNQNQLKLYCEELEIKVKDLEVSKNQLVVSTKKVILDLKRDNQSLVEKLKAALGNKQPTLDQPTSKVRKQSMQSVERLPKSLRGSQKAQNSLRSKLQQYQEVIQSIQASRGKKSSALDRENREKAKV